MNQTISAYIFQIRAERLRRLALPRGVCEAAYKTSVPFPDFRSFFPSYRSSERHPLIFSNVLSVRSSQELLFHRGKADISFQPFRQQEKLTFPLRKKPSFPHQKPCCIFLSLIRFIHIRRGGRLPPSFFARSRKIPHFPQDGMTECFRRTSYMTPIFLLR